MGEIATKELLLEVENLRTYFHVDGIEYRAVDGASFGVERGKTLAIVGESGCGKSVTAYSVLRLIQPPGRIVDGRIQLRPSERGSIDITSLDDQDELMYEIRGGLVSMIFQEPMTALSPVHTISNQLCEVLLIHRQMSRKDAEQVAVEMLAKVGIPSPESRLNQYPFEMSGGMRQRVMIAMALMCRPQLLIADEPTTALDVTTQAQILRLMKELQRDLGTAILLITHDLGVVAQTADTVAVMYLGRIVEQADVRPLMKDPKHPYTRGLLHSLPSLSSAHERLPSIPGSVPSLAQLPAGCYFHPRCPYAEKGRCDVGAPPELREVEGHQVACHRAEEI
jgi:oligopeptide/dipeptide ABC transporter ATP-binding protein